MGGRVQLHREPQALQVPFSAGVHFHLTHLLSLFVLLLHQQKKEAPTALFLCQLGKADEKGSYCLTEEHWAVWELPVSRLASVLFLADAARPAGWGALLSPPRAMLLHVVSIRHLRNEDS